MLPNTTSSLESLFNSNSSSSTGLEIGQLPKTIAYCFLFFVSIVGNSLIVWAIYKDNRLKTTNNFLIANMAVSDFLSTLFVVPVKVSQIYFGNRWFIAGNFGLALCKLVHFFPDASIAVSFYSCLFIAIDRYFAVVHPLRGGFGRSRLKYIIPGIWIFSAVIVSPYFYSFHVENVLDSSHCTIKDMMLLKVHYYVLFALEFGIPLPVITTLYALIVYKLRRHKAPGNPTDIARRRRQQRNRKVLKISAVVVASLFICWMFFSIIGFLVIEGTINRTSSWLFASLFISHMSFTYNFFIYLIFNKTYRENFKDVISKCCCRVIFNNRVDDDNAARVDDQQMEVI